MIYCVHIYDYNEGSLGYEFFSSKEKAKAAIRRFKLDDYGDEYEITQFATPKTKKEVIALLNQVAFHPNKG